MEHPPLEGNVKRDRSTPTNPRQRRSGVGDQGMGYSVYTRHHRLINSDCHPQHKSGGNATPALASRPSIPAPEPTNRAAPGLELRKKGSTFAARFRSTFRQALVCVRRPSDPEPEHDTTMASAPRQTAQRGNSSDGTAAETGNSTNDPADLRPTFARMEKKIYELAAAITETDCIGNMYRVFQKCGLQLDVSYAQQRIQRGRYTQHSCFVSCDGRPLGCGAGRSKPKAKQAAFEAAWYKVRTSTAPAPMELDGEVAGAAFAVNGEREVEHRPTRLPLASEEALAVQPYSAQVRDKLRTIGGFSVRNMHSVFQECGLRLRVSYRRPAARAVGAFWCGVSCAGRSLGQAVDITREGAEQLAFKAAWDNVLSDRHLTTPGMGQRSSPPRRPATVSGRLPTPSSALNFVPRAVLLPSRKLTDQGPTTHPVSERKRKM